MPYKDPDQRRKYQRDWHRENYHANKEKVYAYHKQYWENTTPERIEARKVKRRDYTRINRKKHPDAPQIYYRRNKEKWTNGIDCRDPIIWKKAEKVAEHLVEDMGYTDIFKSSFNDFYFDFLARMNGKIGAFQVTTLRSRSIKRKHIELADYLGFDFYVIHIKPNFEKAYISKILSEFPGRNKEVVTYHFTKGTEHNITSFPSS